MLCQLKRLLYTMSISETGRTPEWPTRLHGYKSVHMTALHHLRLVTRLHQFQNATHTYTFHHTSGLARIMPETTVYTYTNPQLVKHQYHMTTRYHILERLTYTVLSYLLWKHVYSPQAIMSGTSCYMYFKRQKNANRLNPIISCCKQLTHEI